MLGMLVGAWKGGRPLGRLAWGTLACWKPGGGAIPGAEDMPGGGPGEKMMLASGRLVSAMRYAGRWELGDGSWEVRDGRDGRDAYLTQEERPCQAPRPDSHIQVARHRDCAVLRLY